MNWKHISLSVLVGAMLPFLLGIGGPARQGVVNGAVTVTTSATQIAKRGSKSICVHVPAGATYTVYLGNSAVTTATGLPVVAGATFCDDLNLSDGALYGIAGGNQDVRYLGSN